MTRFRCSICARTYLTKGAAETHKKSHFRNQKYNCIYCQVSFKFQRERDVHIKIHQKNSTTRITSSVSLDNINICSSNKYTSENKSNDESSSTSNESSDESSSTLNNSSDSDSGVTCHESVIKKKRAICTKNDNNFQIKSALRPCPASKKRKLINDDNSSADNSSATSDDNNDSNCEVTHHKKVAKKKRSISKPNKDNNLRCKDKINSTIKDSNLPNIKRCSVENGANPFDEEVTSKEGPINNQPILVSSDSENNSDIENCCQASIKSEKLDTSVEICKKPVSPRKNQNINSLSEKTVVKKEVAAIPHPTSQDGPKKEDKSGLNKKSVVSNLPKKSSLVKSSTNPSDDEVTYIEMPKNQPILVSSESEMNSDVENFCQVFIKSDKDSTGLKICKKPVSPRKNQNINSLSEETIVKKEVAAIPHPTSQDGPKKEDKSGLNKKSVVSNLPKKGSLIKSGPNPPDDEVTYIEMPKNKPILVSSDSEINSDEENILHKKAEDEIVSIHSDCSEETILNNSPVKSTLTSRVKKSKSLPNSLRSTSKKDSYYRKIKSERDKSIKRKIVKSEETLPACSQEKLLKMDQSSKEKTAAASFKKKSLSLPTSAEDTISSNNTAHSHKKDSREKIESDDNKCTCKKCKKNISSNTFPKNIKLLKKNKIVKNKETPSVSNRSQEKLLDKTQASDKKTTGSSLEEKSSSLPSSDIVVISSNNTAHSHKKDSCEKIESTILKKVKSEETLPACSQEKLLKKDQSSKEKTAAASFKKKSLSLPTSAKDTISSNNTAHSHKKDSREKIESDDNKCTCKKCKKNISNKFPKNIKLLKKNKIVKNKETPSVSNRSQEKLLDKTQASDKKTTGSSLEEKSSSLPSSVRDTSVIKLSNSLPIKDNSSPNKPLTSSLVLPTKTSQNQLLKKVNIGPEKTTPVLSNPANHSKSTNYDSIKLHNNDSSQGEIKPKKDNLSV